MSDQPDLSTAAQALEDAYEQIGDLGGSAAEVKLTVSWVSPSGRPMSLSIGEIPDDEDDEDDIEYDDDPWMSPTDIAAELSVSREYAGRLLHTGEIPGVVNTGSGERARLRVRRSDLLAWLDTRAVKETP